MMVCLFLSFFLSFLILLSLIRLLETETGEWANDLPEGRGKMTYTDGRLYEGQWRAGKRHGVGTYQSVIGSVSMYTGEWNNSLMHGKGKIVWANGDTYEGQFKENKVPSSLLISSLLISLLLSCACGRSPS